MLFESGFYLEADRLHAAVRGLRLSRPTLSLDRETQRELLADMTSNFKAFGASVIALAKTMADAGEIVDNMAEAMSAIEEAEAMDRNSLGDSGTLGTPTYSGYLASLHRIYRRALALCRSAFGSGRGKSL